MFQVGKSYKVKVELSSGEVGIGRATLVEKQGNKLLIQLRTSRQPNQVLPRGSKFWFVSDSPDNPFNGLWSTMVTGARIHNGKTLMECSNPKFEQAVQKRATERLSLSCPVKVYSQPDLQVPYEIFARNISQSGIGLEASSQDVHEFVVGEHVVIVIESPIGDIAITCRVIRTQYNWLANRTAIGLEFFDMSAGTTSSLAKLLESIGNKQGSEGELEKKRKLSDWMKSSYDNLRLVQSEASKPSATASPEPNDSQTTAEE